MKTLLMNFGLVVMACVLFASCSDEKNYPSAITSSVWSGVNQTKGFYTCNVVFSVDASTGSYCEIAVSSPDGTSVGGGEGRFTYDKATGLADVKFDGAAEGAPSGATLQFDDSGAYMGVKLISTVDYGTYSVVQIDFPVSITGNWAILGNDAYASLIAKFGMPDKEEGKTGTCEIEVTKSGLTEVQKLAGTYTYDIEKGEGALTIKDTEDTYAVKFDKAVVLSITVNADAPIVMERLFAGN